MKQTVQAILLVAILIVEALILLPRLQEKTKEATPVFPELKSGVRAEFGMRDVLIVGVTENKSVYKIAAPSLTYYSETSEAILEQPVGESVVAGPKNLNFSSDVARIEPTIKKLSMLGNVRVEEPDGVRLQNEKTYYDWFKKEVRSAEPTQGEMPLKDGGKMMFSSVGVVSYLPLKRADFLADVKVTQTRPNQPNVVITSDRAQAYHAEQRIHFESNVHLIRESTDLRSRHADVFYETNSVNYAVAYDEVLIRDNVNKRESTSEKAELFASSRKVRLTGLPVLKFEQDEVTGDVIIWDQKLDSVEVEKSSGKIKNDQNRR